MLDIKFIRENTELVRAGCKKKHIECDLDRLLAVDEERRKKLHETELLRKKQNEASDEIAKAPPEKKKDLIKDMKHIAEELKVLDEELQVVEEDFNTLMLTVPSPPADEVPKGKDESDNVELKTWGEIPKLDFKPKSHLELGKDLDMIDIERGVKLAGSRFYFLKNDGALLEFALLQMALDHMIQKGFTPMIVPLLVRDEAMVGTGYFPWGKEDVYRTEKDDLSLIGTAEVSVTSYHMNEILEQDELPKYYVGISPCFRREAGTYGKDTKGLYRIHQFQKVEQVVVCKPEDSLKEHQHILANAEELMQKLKLPYRVMNLCGGELGAGQVQKFDIETWMPSRNSYGETHSCSRFHDFQSRRLGMKYRDNEGKLHYLHTLNNTVIASPRILISLLEIYQQEDGSILIPEALRPYMGGRERISV